jgi:hypothetical protein
LLSKGEYPNQPSVWMTPEWGYGYTAALINYAFLAHAVLTTDQAVSAMKRG